MAGSAGMSVIIKDGTSLTTWLYSPSILAKREREMLPHCCPSFEVVVCLFRSIQPNNDTTRDVENCCTRTVRNQVLGHLRPLWLLLV